MIRRNPMARQRTLRAFLLSAMVFPAVGCVSVIHTTDPPKLIEFSVDSTPGVVGCSTCHKDGCDACDAHCDVGYPGAEGVVGLAFSPASASTRYARNGKSTRRGGNESGKRLTDHRGRNFIPFLPSQHFIPWNRKWPRIRRFMGIFVPSASGFQRPSPVATC